jgi:hypothetical protein
MSTLHGSIQIKIDESSQDAAWTFPTKIHSVLVIHKSTPHYINERELLRVSSGELLQSVGKIPKK